MKVSMDTFFNQPTNLGIMDEDDNEDAISSSSSLSNVSSDSSEFMEDATSSLGSSPSSVLKSDHKNGTTTTTGRRGLYEMDSLTQQLPFKRGLSKYYQGKSQSFTSLSNVRCLEDLAKPSKKKLKSCKSYGVGLSEAAHRTCSKVISKNKASSSSRGSWSSLSGARRPPVAPQRNNSSLFNQTPLFA